MRGAARTDESGDGEISKDQQKDHIDLEMPMFRAEPPRAADAPQVLGKEQGKYGEEYTCDLMPQGAAGVREGLPEATAKFLAASRQTAAHVAGARARVRSSRVRSSRVQCLGVQSSRTD